MKKSNKRQSRHKRSSSQNQIILQKRDIEILKAVFQFRYLTRSQIQNLFEMKSVTRVNIRLRKLYDNKFLDRYYKPTLVGSSEAIYTIGLNACDIVAESVNLSTEEIKRRRRLDQIAKSKFLEHNLKVNDFRIGLQNDVNSNSGIELNKWFDARDCEVKFKYRHSGKETTSSIKPDGYCEVLYQKKLYSFYVEIDLSTSSHSKIKEKLDNYYQFKNKNLFKQKYGREAFYVLIITKTGKRADNLHQLSNQYTSDIFWLTSFDKLSDNILFGKIWKRSGQSEVRGLFQPPKVRIIR